MLSPEDLGVQYVERQKRKVRFVAEHMALLDGNAGMGQFDDLPEDARDAYLEVARRALDACDLFDAQNPLSS